MLARTIVGARSYTGKASDETGQPVRADHAGVGSGGTHADRASLVLFRGGRSARRAEDVRRIVRSAAAGGVSRPPARCVHARDGPAPGPRGAGSVAVAGGP